MTGGARRDAYPRSLYVEGDPVNEFDLDGLCKKRKGVLGAIRNTACGAGNVVTKNRVAKGAAKVARVTGRAAVAVGKDFGKCVTGQPCVIGTIGDYVAVNGALVAMAGLGVAAGVASCVSVVGCAVGGTLGFGGAGAAGYGFYEYNQAFWKEHG